LKIRRITLEFTNCWLQYEKISDANHKDIKVYATTEGNIINNAIEELTTAFDMLYNRRVEAVFGGEPKDNENAAASSVELRLNPELKLGKEAFRIDCDSGRCVVSAGEQAGLLYGVFALIRNLRVQRVYDFDKWSFTLEQNPSNPIRMLDHWDNMDGSIERGYSGNSFFFEKDEIIINERTYAYARLAASVGINAVAINNVNVRGMATWLISDKYYDKLRSLSEIFGSYGIKLYLSINFAAPIEMGGLDTSDPCDERVKEWWKNKAKEIWQHIPEFGGFLVKADSEGRPGPFTYGRSHAEGANMLADAVRPFGGLVIWRCFVYNCQQDWRDQKTDRARAGYDNFMPLDGMFADNVILQIKNGPMDFQVREPVSPLFGGLKRTNAMLELQIAQEYTGQQRHVCYLLPWFKEILDFKTYCGREHDTVADIVAGRTYNNTNCGIVAVANTGNDINWTGHDLAAANWYGFGRLAFDTGLSAEEIASEWIMQTFGYNEKVMENVMEILMKSWPAYEKYTSPLGIGWMVKPNHHYGPDVDGYEYDRWGTYHRANHKAIGVDRTPAGTGYTQQYNEPLASIYADKRTCPQELILFFHRLEYDYVLPSGKTVIQHIYDSHFEGADEAARFLDLWRELEGLIEDEAFGRVEKRLIHQKEHAKEWRDVVNSYFYRISGIEDEKGRPLY